MVGRNAGLGLETTGSGGAGWEGIGVSGSAGFGGFVVGRKPAGLATVGLATGAG